MNSLFNVISKHLNLIEVQTLTRPFPNHHLGIVGFFLCDSEVDFMVCLRSLSCWKNLCVLEHKDMYRWLNILVQDFLVERRMNGSINYGKSSGSWSSKASPDLCTITTRLDCCYDVHFIRCCVSFRLNVTRFILSEKLHFCSSLDVVLGSFVTSCDFGRLTTPGNVHHCIMFHLWLTSWFNRVPKPFATLSRLIDVSDSIISLDHAFWHLLAYFTLSYRWYFRDFLLVKLN